MHPLRHRLCRIAQSARMFICPWRSTDLVLQPHSDVANSPDCEESRDPWHATPVEIPDDREVPPPYTATPGGITPTNAQVACKASRDTVGVHSTLPADDSRLLQGKRGERWTIKPCLLSSPWLLCMLRSGGEEALQLNACEVRYNVSHEASPAGICNRLPRAATETARTQSVTHCHTTSLGKHSGVSTCV